MADWPGCMAPDGGEACAEYSELHGRYQRIRAQADEMAEALSALADAVVNEVNEKGGGGYTLARLSDARAVLARYRGEGT